MNLERRNFLKKLIISFVGIFALAGVIELVVVLFRFLMPFRNKENLKTFVCYHSKIPVGEAKEIKLRGNKLILINNNDKIVAYSASCPHLGCSVVWKQREKMFFCPCHKASFDVEGNVLSGPPPTPLKQYEVSISNNSVFVFVPDNYLST